MGEELVRKIVEALVEDTISIKISVVQDELGETFRIQVAKHELGRLIGKQGRTTRALRTILAGAGMKMKRRYRIEVIGEAT